MKLKLLLLMIVIGAFTGYILLKGGPAMAQLQKEQEQKLLAQLSIGSVYEHYSGKRYRVVSVGRHSEDLSLYVVYEALYDCGDFGQTWLRPLGMFLEKVEINGIKMSRFKKID